VGTVWTWLVEAREAVRELLGLPFAIHTSFPRARFTVLTWFGSALLLSDVT
jgi:hypothetical protein